MNGHSQEAIDFYFGDVTDEAERVENGWDEQEYNQYLIAAVDNGELPDGLRDEAIAALLETEWYNGDNGNRGRLLAHPDCRKCDGTGYFEDFDWVPYGDTEVQMPYSDMCGCTERER